MTRKKQGIHEPEGSECQSFDDLVSPLTAREREVLVQFLDDPNDARIASRLGTSVQTVRNQIASIQKKLGVDGRVRLALKCCRAQWKKKVRA